MKRVLWGLVLTIVPAFVLWGGFSSLRGRQRNTVGTIGDKRITINDWYNNLRLAQLWMLLHTPREEKVTAEDIRALAVDFLVLSCKAKQEKVSVSDEEVVAYIKMNIFGGRPFEEESYGNFLRYISQKYRLNFTSRTFEESIRDILAVEKLIANNVKVEVSETEARALYEKDTLKAKIAYLFVPYDKFKVDVGISESALKEFYDKNKDKFQRQEKIKLKYFIIPHDHAQREEIIKQSRATKNITEIANNFSLTLKETGFIGLKDPIEEIGWQPQLNTIAFSLEDAAVSAAFPTEKGLIVMQRIETRPAFTPALSEIIEEVKQAFIISGAQRDTEAYSKELLDKIIQTGQTDLKSFAKKENLEYKETGLFGYNDYIEGLGVDVQVSNVVFSLNNGQIYSQPLILDKGAYIIQLIEKTAPDESDFAAKKNMYTDRLKYQRQLQARQEFILNCLKQANIKIDAFAINPEQ